LLGEVARFYGWTSDEILSLTMAQFYMYVDQIQPIKKDEGRTALAIATNPHLKGKDQGRLWDRFKDRSTLQKRKPIDKTTPEYKRIQAELERRKRGV
jgi:hypothetical protein